MFVCLCECARVCKCVCMNVCMDVSMYACICYTVSFFFNGLEKLRTGMVAVNDKLDPESFYENLKVTRINPYPG